MPSGRETDSAFRKGDAGTGKPTTDEVESKGWEVEVEVASDFDDSFITRDVNFGTDWCRSRQNFTSVGFCAWSNYILKSCSFWWER